MEPPEPRAASEPSAAASARPLGRGLADVSHVFLSQPPDTESVDQAALRRMPRPLPREPSIVNPLLLRPAAETTRAQIGAALREYAGTLEPGLRIIDAEISCPPRGEIDLLAIDRANQLAIVDFDATPSEELLIRGLDHLDWAVANVSNLRRMFRGLAINFSLPPRLMLIAPQFPSRARRVSRHLGQLHIDWVRYCLLEAPGHTGIFFDRLADD